jgi:hypothetical protein
MVAFASAPAALQWALAVQEAAMYLDYPPTIDRVPQVSAAWLHVSVLLASSLHVFTVPPPLQ